MSHTGNPMRGDYIDFISAYCDRWCERCAFTERCSAYAVHAAMAMCDGDFAAAVDLAVGAPPEDESARERREQRYRELAEVEPSVEESARWHREGREREERLECEPILIAAEVVCDAAHRWLEAPPFATSDAAPEVAEGLEIAHWDCWFIRPKLYRALDGRYESAVEALLDDDPIQNDWNGSAKVALISIDRSVRAWQAIAAAARDVAAQLIADRLTDLRSQVESAFPDARKFRRPGFDGC
jgi:hypothetical protein